MDISQDGPARWITSTDRWEVVPDKLARPGTPGSRRRAAATRRLASRPTSATLTR
jgi:hypothetical protein